MTSKSAVDSLLSVGDMVYGLNDLGQTEYIGICLWVSKAITGSDVYHVKGWSARGDHLVPHASIVTWSRLDVEHELKQNEMFHIIPALKRL